MALPFDLVPNTTRTAPEQLAQHLSDPGFVRYFSDHMAVAQWTPESGWHDSRIENYHPWQIDPGTAVLHYGQEIFEGLKVYRHDDGSIWFFRPEMNARRMMRSAARMDLPILAEEDFLAACFALAATDEPWVPSGAEMSYYMRPFMFADESFLGVRSAQRITFSVIGGPAGPYFGGDVKPVSIWISTTYSRTGAGGTGAAKCGGNYASSLIAQKEGAAHGCSQVLFTDAADHEWVEELGGMNFFGVTADDKLITPPTSGTILDGVTRDSILALAGEFGLTPQERPISLSELLSGVASGDICEAFACGTAAVVTPISHFVHCAHGEEETVSLRNQAGEATRALRRLLVDIQWGRTHDLHGWMHKVEV